jgi:hypothetical protein
MAGGKSKGANSMENENNEMLRIFVLGLVEGNGQNSVVLQLFPSAISDFAIIVNMDDLPVSAEVLRR